MTKVKYTLTAVVPVAQYANLQPAIEVEADSIEDAEKQVLPYIESFFNKYSEKAKIGAEKRALSPDRVELTDIFGNKIFYNDKTHEYTNSLGEVYLSGSQYAKEEEFDADYWAEDIRSRYGLDETAKEQIKQMWEVNGSASNSFGTAVHAAIELFGEHRELADKIDFDLKTGERKKIDTKTEKNSSMSKLPYLKEVVEKFFTKERLAEKAKYEVLVVDHKNKRAGRIDRLLKNEDGTLSIRDMKTNYKILKKEKDTYSKQLSFYGDLLIANGAKLSEDKPLVLHHLKDGEWVDIEVKKVDTLS
jgi:hypothetical protein